MYPPLYIQLNIANLPMQRMPSVRRLRTREREEKKEFPCFVLKVLLAKDKRDLIHYLQSNDDSASVMILDLEDSKTCSLKDVTAILGLACSSSSKKRRSQYIQLVLPFWAHLQMPSERQIVKYIVCGQKLIGFKKDCSPRDWKTSQGNQEWQIPEAWANFSSKRTLPLGNVVVSMKNIRILPLFYSEINFEDLQNFFPNKHGVDIFTISFSRNSNFSMENLEKLYSQLSQFGDTVAFSCSERVQRQIMGVCLSILPKFSSPQSLNQISNAIEEVSCDILFLSAEERESEGLRLQNLENENEVELLYLQQLYAHKSISYALGKSKEKKKTSREMESLEFSEIKKQEENESFLSGHKNIFEESSGRIPTHFPSEQLQRPSSPFDSLSKKKSRYDPLVSPMKKPSPIDSNRSIFKLPQSRLVPQQHINYRDPSLENSRISKASLSQDKIISSSLENSRRSKGNNKIEKEFKKIKLSRDVVEELLNKKKSLNNKPKY